MNKATRPSQHPLLPLSHLDPQRPWPSLSPSLGLPMQLLSARCTIWTSYAIVLRQMHNRMAKKKHRKRGKAEQVFINKWFVLCCSSDLSGFSNRTHSRGGFVLQTYPILCHFRGRNSKQIASSSATSSPQWI